MMKTRKRLLALTVSVMCIASFCLPALANSPQICPTDEVQDYPVADFTSYTGKITAVNGRFDDGRTLIAVGIDKDRVVNFVVTELTYVHDGFEPQVGEEVTGYYAAKAPALAIYPPQLEAWAIHGELDEGMFAKLDTFDKDLISADNMLKLNPSEDTVVLAHDGGNFKAEYTQRKLLVFYSAATHSIPAQTNPESIIVINERVVPVAPGGAPVPDGRDAPISVNGKDLDDAMVYINDAGFTMLPVRAVANALGYTVGWDAQTSSVRIGADITLHPGKDYYTIGRRAPVSLGCAPELTEGKTYVPLEFFTQVAQQTATVANGKVIISSNAQTEL